MAVESQYSKFLFFPKISVLVLLMHFLFYRTSVLQYSILIFSISILTSSLLAKQGVFASNLPKRHGFSSFTNNKCLFYMDNLYKQFDFQYWINTILLKILTSSTGYFLFSPKIPVLLLIDQLLIFQNECIHKVPILLVELNLI